MNVAVPSRRDLLLGAAVAAVAEVELLLSADRVHGPLAWHALTSVLILPALALRRIAPLSATACGALGLAAQPLLGPAPVATPYMALLFFLVSLGWYASLRRGLVGLVLTLLAGLLYDVTTDNFLLADLVVNVALLVMAWGAGRVLRVATDRRVAAELTADRAARSAVLEERSRISRELHDSVAHALTLITLQAGGARERTDQPVAAAALASIEQAGRAALADMHRFLALIGTAEGEGGAGRGAPA